MSFAFCFKLDQSKNLSSGSGLSIYVHLYFYLYGITNYEEIQKKERLQGAYHTQVIYPLPFHPNDSSSYERMFPAITRVTIET